MSLVAVDCSKTAIRYCFYGWVASCRRHEYLISIHPRTHLLYYILPQLLTYLLSVLLAVLPACFLTCLPVLSCLPACLPASLSPCLPACLPSQRPAYWYRPTYLLVAQAVLGLSVLFLTLILFTCFTFLVHSTFNLPCPT